jgi:UDP-glucose 4-epimerase
MKKAMITGAAGFIGRVLQLKLKEAGYYVHGVDIKYTDIACDEFHLINYSDIGRYDYINLDDIDVIFHLGANSLLGPSVTNPLSYYQNNVGNMAEMLNNLIHNKWKGEFIFASSAATYGDLHSSYPIDESMAGRAINPYGSTKIVGEMMLKEACEAYGFKAYAMRFFNVAGSYKNAGQEIDQPHILTKMSMASLNNEKFFINGKYYNTYDGTCVRDYIHVADVCDALIAAEEDLYNKPDGEYNAFNVCTGQMVSNMQLVEKFINQLPLEYDYRDVRLGDPGYLIGNPNKLSLIWKTKPQYGIEDIIKSHYEYAMHRKENKL